MSFTACGKMLAKCERSPGQWSCGLGLKIAANRRKNEFEMVNRQSITTLRWGKRLAAPNILGTLGGRALAIFSCVLSTASLRPAFLIQSESHVPDPKALE